MPEAKVIELSIEETNALRAKLGLKPLDVPSASQQRPPPKEETLELSVTETNALRARLGLTPLQTESTSQQNVQHAPATNLGDDQATRERIETTKLRRDVQKGMDQLAAPSLGTDTHSTAQSWAKQMRKQQHKKKKKKSKQQQQPSEYKEQELHGLNVGHSLHELEKGSTTVLTLADAPILENDDDDSDKNNTLENVNLTEQQTTQKGLQQKRQLELGQGRAGGYAGYDDDEFEELGGTQAPSRNNKSAASNGAQKTSSRTKPSKRRGFQIGSYLDDNDEEENSLDNPKHRAISLEPSQADVIASDFMTIEEDVAASAKFKKKKKKKDKKKKKRRDLSDDEQELPSSNKGLLDELEETAVPEMVSKKRKTIESDNRKSTEQTDSAAKRSRYDTIMNKGNARSKLAFSSDHPTTKQTTEYGLEDEPDDAFLNAALAKARRLNRLKELSAKSQDKGASAVVKELQKNNMQPELATSSKGMIQFEVDETREFTRALLAKSEQSDRKKVAVKKEQDTRSSMDVEPPVVSTVKEEEEDEETEDIHELAKHVEDDVDDMMEGTTAAAPLGRGVGSILGLLKQTGELKQKKTEVLRGRAKDEKNYDDYQPLDLKKVVRIDERTATDKDKVFANREIKLEYRDKHGRLLTRKEAYRDLCYQFHGHGSGKRKEEKKLLQIQREQAEARVASRQAATGTMGALKATQKATGKAFVVHKTGNN